MESNNRYEKGVANLAALMNYWLGRSGLSHSDLDAIASWGMGERSMLDGGLISRIRNAKQSRGASLKHLDGLAMANYALWLWHVKGREVAIKRLGPFSGWGLTPELLDNAQWLPCADDEGQPLDLGDLALLLVGRLELPYLAGQVSAGQAKRMNDRLGELLDELVAENGWSPREAWQRFAEAYPATDTPRRERLRELLLGEPFTQAELELELAALSEMIRQIRRLEQYGPAELQAELLSGHQPACG
jgi:hypothetical protein